MAASTGHITYLTLLLMAVGSLVFYIYIMVPKLASVPDSLRQYDPSTANKDYLRAQIQREFGHFKDQIILEAEQLINRKLAAQNNNNKNKGKAQQDKLAQAAKLKQKMQSAANANAFSKYKPPHAPFPTAAKPVKPVGKPAARLL